MAYNKKIMMQVASVTGNRIGSQKMVWKPLFPDGVWAEINGVGGHEYYEAAAVNTEKELKFKVRYSRKIAEYRYKTERIRIIYDGNIFDVKHIDDYKERHRELTLRGRAINERLS